MSNTTLGTVKTFFRYIRIRNNTTIIAPSSPTRYTTDNKHTPDILDITIMKIHHLNYLIENFTSELFSDHSPISLTFKKTVQKILLQDYYFLRTGKFEKDMSVLTFSLPRHVSKEQLSITLLFDTISNKLLKNTTWFNPEKRNIN